MEVREVDASHAARWDAFVLQHPEARSPHLWEWGTILGPGLLHRIYRLGAYQGGCLVGVLPLIHLRRPLLGSLLVSLPFVNDGGIVADSDAVRAHLLDAALLRARGLNVERLELRHRHLEQAALPFDTDRVGMVLDLPGTVDALRRGFGSKLRNQIKKSEREGVSVWRTGLDGLDAFYTVFAEHMRDLGSPVWPRFLFKRILQGFPERARLYLAALGPDTVGGALVFRFRDTLEIPWASTLRRGHAACANVGLYARILEDAVREGYQTFDFGRSPRDGGTYKFKAQWGAREVPLFWHRWSRRPVQTDGPLLAQRSALETQWRRLPVPLTRLLGPPLRRLLPQ